MKVTCPECNGEGRVLDTWEDEDIMCQNCCGRGTLGDSNVDYWKAVVAACAASPFQKGDPPKDGKEYLVTDGKKVRVTWWNAPTSQYVIPGDLYPFVVIAHATINNPIVESDNG